MASRGYQMAHRSGLCAECTQTLRETCARDYNTVSSNRTIETFRRAAEDGCFVCRTIWNRTEEHSKSWGKVEASSSVELSYNTFYTPTKDTIRDLVMFGVSYLDPTTRHETTTRFELAPTCSRSCGLSPGCYNSLFAKTCSNLAQALRSQGCCVPNACKTVLRPSRRSTRPLLGTRNVYPATTNAKASKALRSVAGFQTVSWM